VDQQRYSRQILFAPIGEEGQKKLSQARVAVVGMGALGTALSNHMARAGVKFLRLIDRDFVEAAICSGKCFMTKPMPGNICRK
jgi:molybdopterin/thiamine biosynthesis adenylyltransferase